MMRILTPTFALVDVRPPEPAAWPDIADKDDTAIWATAVLGTATHVASNTTRHFPPARPQGGYGYMGVEYITGRDFLAVLYGEDDA